MWYRQIKFWYLVVVLLLLAIWCAAQKKSSQYEFRATILQQPITISKFTLQGMDHKIFSADNLRGQWTMLFFGFTNCSSICPLTLATLHKMQLILQEKHTKVMPHVVMISLDPARDNLTRLSSYMRAFDTDFYAATGDATTLNIMAREFSVAHIKIKNADNYQIDHSGAVMLVNPAGKLIAFFTPPLQQAALAEDYLHILGNNNL